MTAKEMFENDLCIVVETEDYIDIYDTWDGEPHKIPMLKFNKLTHWVELNKELVSALNASGIDAIHQQMKELGWTG